MNVPYLLSGPLPFAVVLTTCGLSCMATTELQDTTSTSKLATASAVFIAPCSVSLEPVLDELRDAGLRIAIMGSQRLTRVPPSCRLQTANGVEILESVAKFYSMRVWWNESRSCAILYRGATEQDVARVVNACSPTSSASQRLEAVWEAGWVEDVRVVPVLVDAALSSDAGLALQARYSLRRLGWSCAAILVANETRTLLSDELFGDPAGDQNGAVEALGCLEADSALPLAVKTLGIPNDAIAAEACTVLVRIGGTAAIAALDSMLDSAPGGWTRERTWSAAALARGRNAAGWIAQQFASEDVLVRASAVSALRRTQATNALPILERAVRDYHPSVRASAMKVLASFKGEEVAILAARGLTDPSDSVRDSAATALAQIGGEIAFRALENAVTGEHWSDLDSHFLRALGRMQDARTVAFLEKVLQNPAMEVWATDGLGNHNDPHAVQLLGNLVSSSNATVRSKAVGALARLGHPSAVEVIDEFLDHSDVNDQIAGVAATDELDAATSSRLIQKACHSRYDSVRHLAVWRLVNFGSEDCWETLAFVLRNAKPADWDTVSYAISRFGGHRSTELLRTAMEDGDPQIRERATAALCQMGSTESRNLLRRLRRDPSPAIRIAVLYGTMATRTFDRRRTVSDALDDPSREVRIAAVNAACCLDSRTAVDLFMKASRDIDPEVRSRLFLRLAGYIRTGRDLTPLFSVLESGLKDTDARVRKEAMDSITFAANERVFDLLDIAICDSESNVQTSAIRHGGQLFRRHPSAQARTWMEKILRHHGKEVRCHAFEALAYGSTAHTLPLLERTWRDFDEDLRCKALASTLSSFLPNLQTIVRWACADTSARVRATCFSSIDRMCRGAASPALVRILHDAAITDTNAMVRTAAVHAFGQCAPSDILELATLTATDRDPQVRRGTSEALGESKNEGIFPLLLQLSRDADDSVSASAMRAFVSTSTSNAIPYLLPLLDSTNRYVRLLAIMAVGKSRSSAAIPILAPMLRGTNSIVRMSAVEAIGTVGGESARQALQPLENDSDAQVREWVLWILATFETNKAATLSRIREDMASTNVHARSRALNTVFRIPNLSAEERLVLFSRALDDESQDVRDGAVANIAYLDSDQAWTVLEDAFNRPNRAGMQRKILDEAIRASIAGRAFKGSVLIEKALSSADVELRRCVVDALSATRDGKTRDILIARLAKEPDEALRKRIVSALKDGWPSDPLIQKLP